MARVRVYRFKVWDQMSGTHIESERLATLELIEASKQFELIPDGVLEVDSSLLDADGMTRQLGSGACWAYAALDDSARAYVVIEPLFGDPQSLREAYPLLPSDTLQHAELIAEHFNRYGSYMFRGGAPLLGDQIPSLHTVPRST